jgi:hypothetical protein
VDELTRFVVDEFMIALGLSPQGLARRALDPLLRVPAGRFARLAGGLEDHLVTSGLVTAMSWLLSQLVESVEVRGAEHVPVEGPLLVASNHPGAYDGVAIMASLGRDDVKVVISDVPLTRALPAVAQHLIYVTPGTSGRMAAVRSMIRHLRAGGALLIFPSGLVDPDPDLQPGSEQALETWSPSLELLLHRVPEASLVVSIVSGVLARSSMHSPFTRLAREAWKKRKLAEFLQVSQQLVFSKGFDLDVRLSFGEPVTAADLGNEGASQQLLPTIVENARAVLRAHAMWSPTPC